jgi:hypothetical protein
MSNVFISYSHDTDTHRDRVRELAEHLRRDGVIVVIDRDKLPGGPDEGWPTWSEAQVKECDQVLVACTERYCRSYEGKMPEGQGLGAACEAGAIRQILYNQANINRKFRVILFEEGDGAHVPLGLQRYHRFELWRPASYAELLAWVKPNPTGVQQPVKPAAVPWPELINRPACALANRDEEFDCFERMIQGQTDRRILLIRGASNRGKTALLGELLGLANMLGVVYSHIDLKGCPPLDQVLETIAFDALEFLPTLSNAPSGRRQLALLGDLQHLPRPLILAFDTCEKGGDEFALWLETQLLGRVARCPALLVVVCGQVVPDQDKHTWGAQVTTFELPPIREDEKWRQFCACTYQGKSIDPKHVEGLVMATNGEPGVIAALLKTLAASLPSTLPAS